VRPTGHHEYDSLKEGLELLREELACEAVAVLEAQKNEEETGEDDETSAKEQDGGTDTVNAPEAGPSVGDGDAPPPPQQDDTAQVNTSADPPASSLAAKEPQPTTPTPISRPRPLPRLRPPAHLNPALLPPLAEHIETVLLGAALSCDGSCLHPTPSQPLTGSWELPSQPSSPPVGGFTAAGAFSPPFSPTMGPTPTLASPPRGHGSEGSREKEKEKEGAGVSKFVGNIFRTFASTPARETPSSLSSMSSAMVTPIASDTVTPILGGTSGILNPGVDGEGKKYDCKGVLATTALVSLFVEMAFGGGGLGARPHHAFCVRMYSRLLSVLKKDVPIGSTPSTPDSPAPLSRPLCPKVRLIALSFFMRLRADRDHRIWMLDDEEVERETRGLAGVVRRLAGSGTTPSAEQVPLTPTPAPVHVHHPAQLHTHVPLPPRGRQTSADRQRDSRSRSRPPPPPTPHLSMQSGHGQGREEVLWSVPETAVFKLPGAALPHDGIQTHIVTSSISGTTTAPAVSQPLAAPLHDPVVLQINDYLSSLVAILTSDNDHNIVSYVLCHLPAQLANKHFFCGPKTRPEIIKLLEVLCDMVTNDGFARIVPHQSGSGSGPGLGFGGIGGAAAGNAGGDQLRTWDVNAVAYHTLMVLISYQASFPKRTYHDRLVSTFIKGLVPHSPTARPTLDALTLCAFELQQSMIRHLSDIVARLSQIMSNTPVAVHILDFLGFVATRPVLFASFTEEQHKMVFGVVLQYLTVHERGGAEAGGGASWALRQHVLAYTYYVLYALVLALPVRERKLYVPYITRQLLAANEGRAHLDERSEVAFDWLIRYTYSSADPRPADSFLRSLVMPEETDGYAKNPGQTWVFETSVLTIRTSAKPGWVELDTRRPSGRTVMLARLENVPLAGLGEHEPDLVTEGAQIVMRRDPEWMEPAVFPGSEDEVGLARCG